ncbi:MAG: hypothetical protein ABJC19_02895 [Gemmatimonadota bacterium]
MRARALAHLGMVDAPGSLPECLADAGSAALRAAVAAGDDRRAALDLLAADALITLAMLASAEQSPTSLEADAAALRLGTARFA